jgi:hypothetical protein
MLMGLFIGFQNIFYGRSQQKRIPLFSVYHPPDLYATPNDHVEHKVIVNYQDPVAQLLQSKVNWDITKPGK